MLCPAIDVSTLSGEALDALCSGKAYSLVGYDRGASHFFPFVAKELPPTEPEDEPLDVDAMEADASGEEAAGAVAGGGSTAPERGTASPPPA